MHTVFHLAGIRRGATRDDFMKVNAEGTRHVCDAMVAAGAKRLVLVGSLAATGPSIGGVPRVEEDALRAAGMVRRIEGRSRAASPSRFSASSRSPAADPRASSGPGDHENLTFFKLVKKGLMLRIGGAERKLSFVDVEDVVDQLLLQADRPEAVGEAFFAASDETAERGRADAHRGAGAQALTRAPSTCPSACSRLLGSAADVITNVTGKKLPLNRKLARQLLAPGWTCRIDKARQLLGYAPRRTIADSLKRSAESYLALGWL